MICRLSDRPDQIPLLAAAYEAEWPGWYGPGGEGDALIDLKARARCDGLPLGLVAVEDGTPVGACALAGESMSLKGDFGAWLVGLWVAPSHRGRGLAGRLLAAAVKEARSLGIAELRAGTAEAAGVFERAGWRSLPPVLHDGREVRVYGIRP